jgi:hypothetical protein
VPSPRAVSGGDSQNGIIQVVFSTSYKILERYFETVDGSSLLLNYKLYCDWKGEFISEVVAFWSMELCSFVALYQRFEKRYYLHLRNETDKTKENSREVLKFHLSNTFFPCSPDLIES